MTGDTGLPAPAARAAGRRHSGTAAFASAAERWPLPRGRQMNTASSSSSYAAAALPMELEQQRLDPGVALLLAVGRKRPPGCRVGQNRENYAIPHLFVTHLALAPQG